MRTDDGQKCPPPAATGDVRGRGSVPGQCRVHLGPDQGQNRTSPFSTNGHIVTRKDAPLYDLLAERLKPQALKAIEDRENARRELRQDLERLQGSTRVHSGDGSDLRFSVEVYPHGRRLVSHTRITPPSQRGQQRGKVNGLSIKSRQRLQAFLLEHEGPYGSICWALDLTVPGPELARESSGDLRRAYLQRLQRAGCAVVWRKEIQPDRGTCGVEHWHCILWAPPSLSSSVAVSWWWESLENLGAVEWRGRRATRDRLPGARRYSAHIAPLVGDRTARYRYLLEHTSKRKEEQAKTSGRAWGIAGKELFVESQGEKLVLDRAVYYDLLRLERRRICAESLRVKLGVQSKRAWRRSLSMGRKCWGSRGSAISFDLNTHTHLVITIARYMADGKKDCKVQDMRL